MKGLTLDWMPIDKQKQYPVEIVNNNDRLLIYRFLFVFSVNNFDIEIDANLKDLDMFHFPSTVPIILKCERP